MSTWHYADRDQHQQGPVDASVLQAAYARGEIGPATLVWREGMSSWQPLAHVAHELGIATTGAPPPLPAAPRQGPVIVAPPTSKSSGCLIAIIVAAVIGVPVLGIMLAIAIPAYQDYTVRAKIAQGLNAAAPLKLVVQETWLSEERCPVHGDSGTRPAGGYGDPVVVESITLGEDGDGACTVTVAYRPLPAVDGDAVLVLVRDGDGWRYRTSIDNRYLPSMIRNNAEPLD